MTLYLRETHACTRGHAPLFWNNLWCMHAHSLSTSTGLQILHVYDRYVLLKSCKSQFSLPTVSSPEAQPSDRWSNPNIPNTCQIVGEESDGRLYTYSLKGRSMGDCSWGETCRTIFTPVSFFLPDYSRDFGCKSNKNSNASVARSVRVFYDFPPHYFNSRQ